MKKLTKGALFLAIIGTTMIGCEKDNSSMEPKNESITSTSKSESANNLKCGLCQDELTLSLLDFGNYMNQQDDIHEGDLVEYVNNNPDFSFTELENLGYIDAVDAQQKMDIITDEIITRTDDDIIDVFNHIIDTDDDFYSEMDPALDPSTFGTKGSTDPSGERRSPKGWTFLRITGLFSPGPNCIRFFWWEGGGGC